VGENNHFHKTVTILSQGNGCEEVANITRCSSLLQLRHCQGTGSGSFKRTEHLLFRSQSPVRLVDSKFIKILHLVQQFQFLRKITHAIPDIVMARISPDLLAVKRRQAVRLSFKFSHSTCPTHSQERTPVFKSSPAHPFRLSR
jgi:hypothetical protein